MYTDLGAQMCPEPVDARESLINLQVPHASNTLDTSVSGYMYLNLCTQTLPHGIICIGTKVVGCFIGAIL